MAKLGPLLVCLSVASALGCDRTSEREDCRYVAPSELEHERSSRCPTSEFPEEPVWAREVAGFVRRGEEPVAGALVRVSPWRGLPTSEASAPASTTTDRAGFYGGLRTTGLRYDLLVLLDARERETSDVLFYRGAGWRFFEPSIEVERRALPAAWSAHLDVELEGAPSPGRAVAFFASGEGVFGVSGDVASGLTVHTRDYSARVTLHALAYDRADGLASASAYATAEVFSEASARRPVKMALAPIAARPFPRFVAAAPTGFVPRTVDVIIGFSRTSDARLATVPLDRATTLPIIPNAGYTYRARAEHEGAISDTGETWFDVYQEEVGIALPRPPVLEAPVGALERGELLVASGSGVLEHLLEPEEGGGRLRLLGAEGAAELPDLEPLGVPRPAGVYRWRVRSFPTARYVEEISGSDARRYRPMAESAARVIELR